MASQPAPIALQLCLKMRRIIADYHGGQAGVAEMLG